jgi:hypothetical protein
VTVEKSPVGRSTQQPQYASSISGAGSLVWPLIAAGRPMVSGAPSSRDSALPIQFPSDLAVAAGFEPAEGCPSRAFEFCGWWFRPVRLGLVAPEPRLGSPLRTALNLRE